MFNCLCYIFDLVCIDQTFSRSRTLSFRLSELIGNCGGIDTPRYCAVVFSPVCSHHQNHRTRASQRLQAQQKPTITLVFGFHVWLTWALGAPLACSDVCSVGVCHTVVDKFHLII